MSVDKFIDEQGLKMVGVSVGGSKSQGGDERFGPLNFLPFVGYNRDLPRKPGLLFTLHRNVFHIGHTL
jgi:hypothetical protein